MLYFYIYNFACLWFFNAYLSILFLNYIIRKFYNFSKFILFYFITVTDTYLQKKKKKNLISLNSFILLRIVDDSEQLIFLNFDDFL